MARISPKSRKLLIIGLFSIIAVFSIAFFVIKSFKVEAQDVETIPTSVVVGNSAPTFTTGPAEAVQAEPLNHASTATRPTNIGVSIKFNAKATDANGESYYFIVCPTGGDVTVGTPGNPPTCATGENTEYCKITSPVTSGTATSCSYTTKAGDAWSNAWHAFVCDTNTSPKCTSSQGSGDSGSPFFVNHPPTFTSITPTAAAVDPGTTITWETQDTSDPDTGSTVILRVCKSNSISASGTCTNGEWCSTSTPTSSNPGCSYQVPPVNAAGENAAYAFVVDQFGLASASKNVTFTVNNVAPTIANITLNGANVDITLTESSTKAVPITATVTDNNGCSTLSSVKAYLYRSGKGYTNCDTSGEANGNFCYPEITCSTSSCSGATATYSCTANMQYFADPTDTGSIFASENWLTTIKATDSGSLVTNTAISTGKDVRKLIAFDIQPKTLEYGDVPAGTSIPLNKGLKTQATGNVGINQTHHADSTKSFMCTDFPTCNATGTTRIPITNQRYSMTNGAAYNTGTALSTTPTTVLLKVKKPTSSAVPQEKSVYWGILVDSGTKTGTYEGQNIITAETSATADW